MKKVFVSVILTILIGIPVYAQTNTTVDVTNPIISSVSVSSITKNTALVSWKTNEPATSYVDFGPTDIYGNTFGLGDYITTHSVSLSSMTAETLYHFRIRSKDAAGNEAVSTDTTFTTLASTTNTNLNTNTAVNSNTNAKTNLNGNINTNKNSNANKNTNLNANKNTNLNSNKNTNLNRNVNVNTNVNANLNGNTNEDANLNINEDITNANLVSEADSNTNSSEAETTNDGRIGLLLIVGGVILLVVIIIFAWKKLRQPPALRP
ncbi:MAG: hypothetical protein WCT08_01585 [Patescibacteria group bacterium]|jgi:hypothetical protein